MRLRPTNYEHALRLQGIVIRYSRLVVGLLSIGDVWRETTRPES